ncbi:DUF4249 domain-containing protein [Flavobacterium sp. HXWNR29]|uniref:DUF4249 domain-containing protein n=1 Tax=Flavobacterium odoriferum TaxID=2946604 RepID=UPI0021CB0132|nr:DUF4249 domain-containing protein [Flavobacterium sp. HXWNR29]MCU4189739.1 DUF4249 domain-containing protein [Flavobacterium sp. HXWNR29]
MKKNISIKSILQLLMIFSIVSCTEPYALQSNTYESALVVEAVLTNEAKQHEVKLTKTYRLEENENEVETGAVVKIYGDDGSVQDFEEIDGIYKSTNIFQAIAGVKYKLTIETSNGNNYVSNLETLTTVTPLEEITASAVTNNGVRGVEIAANSYDPLNTSKYYRYTYEETYKVIVPRWSPNKLTFTSDNEIIISLRDDPQTRTCYTTNKSNNIILASTIEMTEDRVTNFPVKFIPQNNYSIANRYSILVKQYVESFNSYNFYRILKSFSNSENVLSQIQPGFIYGNIQCTNNPNEKVIGIFNVASVSSKRIFFNYEEIFPGELFPDYLDTCDIKEFDSSCFGPSCAANGFYSLKSNYMSGKLVYYASEGVIFKMVKPVCGDCTTFSSNVIPAFWE